MDADPSNELQSLSLSNDTLYLSQGNNVVLPPDSDGDATNELQVLSLSNDTLYLTSGGYVVLPPDSDGDATNELQVLSLSNDTLYLTSGGYVVLPQEIDADTTNEIQALNLSNDTLYLTDGGFAVLPQELDSDTTNEIQALSLSNDTLYLSDGGFAVLPQEIDSDTTNEIQTLSYSNDTLSISNGNNVTINSSNFDFIYPDGKTGITPISFSTGVGSYAGAAWPFVEASLEVNYQVPTGKNLYIINTSSSEPTHTPPEILINGNLIFKTYSDVIYNGFVYNSVYSPIILSSGDSLKMKPGKDINYINNSSTINTIIAKKNSINGFLVDKKVEVVTRTVNSVQTYTVPTGKILVILNIQGESIELSSNNFSFSGGGYNGYTSSSSGTHQTKILKNPIFFNENDVISGTSSYWTTVFNGYLINK